MTDDPHDPSEHADAAPDVTPAEAQELRALFGDLVADEPATRVTPSTVLRAAQGGRPSDGRTSGRTAGRLRIGLLAAAVVAVLATGTVLLTTSDPNGTAAPTGTTVAAGSTTAAATGAGAPSGAPASPAATTAAGSMSGSGPVTESGSMTPSPAPSSMESSDASTVEESAGSSSAMSSAAGSGTSASTAPGICRSATSAALARVRAATRGTPLEGARITLCRDPATLAASAGPLLLNVRPSSAAGCVDDRPACRRLPGSADAYTSEAGGAFRIWAYGRGHEVFVLTAARPTDEELTALVTAARPLLAVLS